MDKKRLVLAALAPAQGLMHTPVQVQKLLFLIDRNIPAHTEGPTFDFQPYDYGPFDSAVYHVLDQLSAEGLVEAVEEPSRRWKRYRLTAQGQEAGNTALAAVPEKGRDYIRKVSEFVRSLSFADLVSAIYHAYPDMKVNSVFGK